MSARSLAVSYGMLLLLALVIATLAASQNFLGRGQLPRWTTCRSHSRPDDVPPAKRNRMLQRPRQTFKRHTGMSKRNKDLYFANWPLEANSSRPGRNPKFGRWRRTLKESKSSKELLKYLNVAMSKLEVDASVISAAMQKCGYSRWWGTLLKVHEAQKTLELQTDGPSSRIFLTAIATCLKDPGLLLRNLKQGTIIWAYSK